MNRGKELVGLPDLRGLRTFGDLGFYFCAQQSVVMNSSFTVDLKRIMEREML